MPFNYGPTTLHDLLRRHAEDGYADWSWVNLDEVPLLHRSMEEFEDGVDALVACGVAERGRDRWVLVCMERFAEVTV